MRLRGGNPLRAYGVKTEGASAEKVMGRLGQQ